MTNAAIILVACVALAGGAFAQSRAVPDKRTAQVLVSEGKFFEFAIPDGWGTIETTMGRSSEDKGIYGVDMIGPEEEGGIAPSISVKYFAKGNALFRSAELYLRIHSEPIPGLGIDGDEYGAVTDFQIAGRIAKSFDRKKHTFIGPKRIKMTPIPVYERYIVLPAGENFYVLHYYSVYSSAKTNLPAFDSVVASFEPLIK